MPNTTQPCVLSHTNQAANEAVMARTGHPNQGLTDRIVTRVQEASAHGEDDTDPFVLFALVLRPGDSPLTQYVLARACVAWSSFGRKAQPDGTYQ